MTTVVEHVTASTRSFTAVFHNPALRRINLALAASVIGDWAYSVAVAVWVFQEHGAAALGFFGVARYVTMAILGPLMATAADRFPKRLVMVVADVARAITVVGGAVVIAADGPAVLVYSLGLLTSIFSLAFRPAQSALLPRLATEPQQLTSANVVASTIESLGFFVGPAIAGFLLAITDVEVVYLVNAASFVVSAILLSRLVEPPDAAATETDGEPAGDQARGLFRDAAAGFAVIRRNSNLRLIAALMAAQTVVAGASLVYEVSIALDLLDLGESGLGLLDAVLGVGGILGGFVVLVLARRQRLAGDFGIGVILWSAPLLLIAAFPSLGTTLVAMFLIGLANSMVDVNAFTIVQRLAPAEVMGRVFGALESLLTAGMAVGALLMPLLIEVVGLRAGLVIVAGAVSLAGIAGLSGLHRIDAMALAPSGLGLVRGVPMLAVLPPPVQERLAHVLVPVTVPAGEVAVGEGERADRFWIIERGDALVSIGGEPVRQLGPGDSFGEIALLRDVPRTATVQAGDEDLVLRGLDRDEFLPAVTGHGEANEVADAVVERWLALG
jgi:MFS family permease